MAKGYVLHEGPSPFDGQPIVSIATLHSSNRKTGDMVQTWILPRDLHPLDAVKTGQDSCICGNCPHRGSGTKRTCLRECGPGASEHLAHLPSRWLPADQLL